MSDLRAIDVTVPPDDCDSWSKCPIIKDGEPLMVNMRIDLVKVSDVDTVQSKVHVKMYVITYWTDPRRVNHEGKLPDKLWGPHFTDIENAAGTPEVREVALVLVNKDKGRLKRVCLVDADVEHEMDLHEFPLDVSKVPVVFLTTSAWMTLDESDGGVISLEEIISDDASVLPFGITCINITDMLAKFLMFSKAVDKMDALLSAKPFWKMFIDPNALLVLQEVSAGFFMFSQMIYL